MLNRRDLLKNLSGFLTIPSFLDAKYSGPIVISTWDSGLEVNEAAWEILKNKNGKAIDAVEKGAIYIEDIVSCCVGLGGNPDRDGKVTLDACIMDEKSNCGGVAFLEKIQNPISVARKVMEDTEHVLLVGEGAQSFALSKGFKLESGLLSADAEKSYKSWLEKSKYQPQKNIELNQRKNLTPSTLENGNKNHDTMALLALDKNNDLSGACTTSGMAFKMRGRVGDSPIIGAGLYVDNEVGAAAATGQGEEVIRVAGSSLVVEFMRQGKTPEQACRIVIEKIIKINPKKAKDFQVAFIAISKNGKTGAFAVNPGFIYCVKDNSGKNIMINAKSYY